MEIFAHVQSRLPGGAGVKVLEELPKENQTGEGRESLMFEGESGNERKVFDDDWNYFSCETGFPFLSLSFLTIDNIRKMGPFAL